MALATRHDSYGLETGIKTEELFRTSKLLATIIGFPIPANKAIVGKNAFAHESGIHQDGVLKERSTYEIMKPESIGRKSSDIVLGRHSGKHGFTKKLSELGYVPDKETLEKAWQRFAEVADKKKEVFDDDLVAIIEDALHSSVPETWKLEYVNFTGGNTSIPTATVVLTKNGERFQEAATGDGPVDAIYSAVNRIINISGVVLEQYSLSAVTGGMDALGEASVSIRYEEKLYSGRAAATDVVLASCRAYVNAINRMLVPVRKV
jgi:2-isopropylmalate synthase